jgi:hypothetical protein
VVRFTLATATNFANILVGIPHVVATDTAALTLNKDLAATSLIAPTISIEAGATKETMLVIHRA